MALASDASAVAYCVQDAGASEQAGNRRRLLTTGAPTRVAATNIWVTDLESLATTVLGVEASSSWSPAWSPDGSTLAFYSDRNGVPQVWLWQRSTGTSGLASPAAAATFFPFERLQWLPGGRHLVVKLRTAGWDPAVPALRDTQSVGQAEVWTSPSETAAPGGEHWSDRNVGDLAVIDLASGGVQRLLKGRRLFGCRVSPRGDQIAFMTYREQGPAGLLFDLNVIGVDGSGQEVLVERVPQGYGNGFAWSPDGQRLAYTVWTEEAAGHLMVTDMESGSQHRFREPDANLASEDFPPVWSPDGGTIFCDGSGRVYAVDLESGRVRNLAEDLSGRVTKVLTAHATCTAPDLGVPDSIVIGVMEGSRQEALYRLDTSQNLGGVLDEVIPPGHRRLLDLTLAGDCAGGWVVGAVESASEPPSLMLLHVGSGSAPKIIPLNPEIDVDLGEPRLVPWQDASGRTRFVALALPPDWHRDEPPAAVVHVYGGEMQSGRYNAFGLGRGLVTHLFTSRGLAVLFPDMPLSRGGTPGAEIVDAVQRAVDAAVDDRYVDGNRLGVFGHSYGGYSVNTLITHTDRFAAAAASAGISDLTRHSLSMAGQDDLTRLYWAERGYGRMHAPPWQAPDHYVENSPVFFADRVTTPLLLLHGTEDDAVGIDQSEAMYAALHRLGKVVTLVRYHGEGHRIGDGDRELELDYWQRIIGWFQRYLH